jgi:uncharacterized protein DUF397
MSDTTPRVTSEWRKAQRSNDTNQCVEVASTTHGVALRDSKNPQGPVHHFTSGEFESFLDGAKKGEFDDLV